MAFEIFGFTVGDLAAIGALIASPLIFWFGYSRTRKSEQIKIARECMDRIKLKHQKFDEFDDKNPHPPVSDMDTRKFVELTEPIRDVLLEIEYFSYLVDKHEIGDKIVIRYYYTKVMPILGRMEHAINRFSQYDPTLQVTNVTTLNEVLEKYYEWIKGMYDIWHRYRKKGDVRTRVVP